MNVRAWAIRTGGWAGTVTADDGSPSAITPPAFGSSISQALYIRDQIAYVTAELTSAGLWRFGTSGSNYSLTESGNVLTRLGLTAAPYSTAATHTGVADPLALMAPYQVDVAIYDPSAATTEERAVSLYQSSVRRARGRAEWRRPVFRAGLDAPDWLQAVEDWNDYLSTPAEIDILWQDDAGAYSYQTVAADSLKVQVRDTRSLRATLEIGSTEAVA